MDAEVHQADTKVFERAVQRLRSAGLRYTRFRQGLIELLVDQSPRAVSISEILEHPSTRDVDLVTIYRNVESLSQINLLKRISDEAGKPLFKLVEFDCLTLSITCRDCHAVHESPLAMHEHLESVAKEIGYTALSSRFEVTGYCKDCAQKRDLLP